MSNFVRADSESTRGPSPAIWGDLAGWEAKRRMGDATLVFEDFEKWNTSTTNGTSYQNGWTVVADDGPILTQLTDPDPVGSGEFGVVRLSGADADNDELYITNSVTGVLIDIDNTTRKIAFEIRMLKETVADAALTFFAGLASVGAAVAGTLAADVMLVCASSLVSFTKGPATRRLRSTGFAPARKCEQTMGGPVVQNTWAALFLFGRLSCRPNQYQPMESSWSIQALVSYRPLAPVFRPMAVLDMPPGVCTTR